MRIMMLRAHLVVGAMLLAGAGPAAANDRRFVEHVATRVAGEAQRYVAAGYAPVQRSAVAATPKADGRRLTLNLEGGAQYALIAACDQDCGGVELRLYDAKRALVARMPEGKPATRQSVVSFAGKPGYSGRYEVEIVLTGCRERTCHTGFAVLEQNAPAKATAVRAPAVIVGDSLSGSGSASIAGGSGDNGDAARVAGFTAHAIERRAGVELQADNYRQLRDVSFAGCEQVCATDGRCRAIEHYRNQQTCGLFDHVPAMRAARDIDAGVKRTAAP